MKFLMKEQIPRLMTLGVIGVILGGTVVGIWAVIDETEKSVLTGILNKHPALILTAAFLFPVAVIIAVNWVFRHYIEPLRKMAEDIKLFDIVNSSHRLQPGANKDLTELANAINSMADKSADLRSSVQNVVNSSQQQIQSEKNILAALIDEFPDGIVACNYEGQILLYNRRSTELLSMRAPGSAESSYLGLGRSIFGFMSRDLIAHALAQIAIKLTEKNEHPISRFVTVGSSGTLVQAEAAPILNESKSLAGFILLLSDAKHLLNSDPSLNEKRQELFSEAMAKLARIRQVAEQLGRDPEMVPEKWQGLARMIHGELDAMRADLDALATQKHDLQHHWNFDEADCKGLLQTIKRYGEQTLDVHITVRETAEQILLCIETLTIIHSLIFVIEEIKKATGVMNFILRAGFVESEIAIDVMWKGKSLPAITVAGLENQRIRIHEGYLALRLRDVLAHHRGRISSQADDASSAFVRLSFPAVKATRSAQLPTVVIASRPEFYDFDLFQKTMALQNLGGRKLSELTFTSFDCETTGLQPSAGDEIISVGAIRIVNGRLLQQESFDQLVDPKRSLRAESVHIHGIDAAALHGQPTIEKVLPRFFKFVEGSILVGHNAAFDMRFIELKESRSGVKFNMPVLDTLLLSAVVHPYQDDHSLESIAKRVGVTIIGRHTALGDALVTGEIFVRLLPLLDEKGIRTLNDALGESKRTYLSRVKY